MKITRVLLSNILTKAIPQHTEREIAIKAPWGNITGLTWGDPKNPPVLLCHGRLDTCSSFRPLVNLLPDNFFYVAVDLPGNGRSDHLPRGIRYSVVDFVPTLSRIKSHFEWDKFDFIGHSLGAIIGKYFNFVYPNHITRFVELAPFPAYLCWSVDELSEWYEKFYEEFYSDEKYMKLNGGKETAPTYSYEKIRDMMMKARNLPKEAIEHILERAVEPAGNGLYRITFDQRMKFVTIPPYSSEYLKHLFTYPKTPILCILGKEEVDGGLYSPVPFITDEKQWPNGNFKVKFVDGGHDVHVGNPGCMSGFISSFLLENQQIKEEIE